MKHIPIYRTFDVRLTTEECKEIFRYAASEDKTADQVVEMILRGWILERQLLLGK